MSDHAIHFREERGPNLLRPERVGGRPQAAGGCIAATYPPETAQ
jgi:hypothetical protein